MKTLLYVEESENALVSALIKRRDINLILIRFSNCMIFSDKHKSETAYIPTFIIDKSKEFEKECYRLNAFLHDVCDGIDVFYNDSEFNQVYIQHVAEMLHLPGALSQQQAILVRDKYLMKNFIKQLGFSCPEFVLLSSKKDAFECAYRWGYPFIIKWRMGVSSIAVYKINSLDELNSLDIDYDSKKYIAEQYQSDKIWCIDAISSNGKVIENFYTWLPFTNLDFAETKDRFTQIAVGRPQKNWKFDSCKITQDIISGLGLKSGYLHLEVFVTEEGSFSVCEFAWRTPGDHMMQNFSALYQTSIEDYLIDVLIGKEISKLSAPDSCVADVFLPLKSGKITNISTIEEIMQKCTVIDGTVYYKKNDYVKSVHKYTDSSGWVQVTGNKIEDILQKVEEVYRAFLLEVEVY